MKARITLLLCLSLCVIGTQVWGQGGTSSIVGTVQDGTGAVIVGAKVAVKNQANGLTYSTTTTSAGTYKLDALPPGQYTVTVSHSGFQTLVATNNVVSVGVPVVVNLVLKVGRTAEVVEVQGSYQRIETTSATVSDVITGTEVVSLPLNGRNPLGLITLEPGLVQRTNNSTGSGTHVFGSRDRSHNVTIDGIDANESSVPNPQSNLYRLNPDNVEEFRVVTHNATPETGRNSGANVSIATRTGTNELHGDIFYFNRNTALNANEWFNNYDGLPRPVLLMHQFGTDLGGPIIKDKTHWFFSYQGARIAQTMPINAAYGSVWVYNQDLYRNGNFRYFKADPNNPLVIDNTTIKGNSYLLVDPTTGQLRPEVPVCATGTQLGCVATFNIFTADTARGGAGLDPLISAMLGKLPAPNTYSGVGDGLNYGGFDWNPPSRFSGPHFLGKIDHKLGENDTLFGTFLNADWNTKEGDFTNARPQVLPGFPPEGTVSRNTQLLSVNERHVFSPSMVNELTIGFSRFRFDFPMAENNPPSQPPLPYGQDCWSPVSFRTATMPYCNAPMTHRAVVNYQLNDNFGVTRGPHYLRTGFSMRLYQHNDFRGPVGGFNIAPTIIFNPYVSGSYNIARDAGFTRPSGISSGDWNRLRRAATELLGIPAYINEGFVLNPATGQYVYSPGRLHTRLRQFNAYGQDEWKARRNLTVNYGVRWEMNMAPSDAGGAVYVPDHPVDGSAGRVTYVKSDHWYERNNALAFAPRVGLAWSPNEKTVVRAGYGLAFDTISTFQATAIGGKVPGSILQVKQPITGTAIDNRLSAVMAQYNPFTLPVPTTAPNFSPDPLPRGSVPDVGAFAPNLRMPTVHEWSLTIQRELPWRMVGQVGYIGKRGTRLFRPFDINQVGVEQAGFLDAFNVAYNNVHNGCNWDGTVPTQSPISGIPVCGAAGPTPTLLVQLGGRSAAMTDMNTYSGLGAAAEVANLLDARSTASGGQLIVANGFPANYFRPNPQFGQIFYMDNSGDSYYHGMIAQLRRRFEKGLEFGLVYTWSRSIDDQSIDPVGSTSGGGLSTTSSRSPTDAFRPWVDRAVSDFNNTHVFTAHYVYELPLGKGQTFLGGSPAWLNHIVGGWQMTGMYTWQSGEPFTLNSGVRTVNTIKESRAVIVGQMPDARSLKWVPGIKGPVYWQASDFDYVTNCRSFVGVDGKVCVPPPGSYGGSRNAVLGPGFWNFDFGVTKNFAVTERVKLQFRTEFFNLFNHPNFENPRNATSGSPGIMSSAFGWSCCGTASLPSSATIISVGEPYRVVQFGIKLSF